MLVIKSDLEIAKAINRSKLVRQQKQVIRNGKPVMTYVWVNPDKNNKSKRKKSNSLDDFFDSLGWDDQKKELAKKSLTERQIKTDRGIFHPKDFIDASIKDDILVAARRTGIQVGMTVYHLNQYDFNDMVLYQYANYMKNEKDFEKFKNKFAGKTIENPIQIDYRLRDFAKVNKIEEDKIWKNVGGIKNLNNIEFSNDGTKVILNYKDGNKKLLEREKL